MPWIQVTFCAGRTQAPLIEAALENAGALAVTPGDAADEPQLEPPPGTTPLWSQVTLTALFPDEPQALTTARALARSLADHLTSEPRFELDAPRTQDEWMLLSGRRRSRYRAIDA